MPIRLNFIENVQNVIVSDRIEGDQEKAAQAKLEEKMNQGRMLIHFDLKDVNLDDKPTLESLKKVINYCTDKNGKVALSGISPKKLSFLNKTYIEVFATAEEAAAWFRKWTQEEEADEIDKKRHLLELMKQYEKYLPVKEPKADLQAPLRAYETEPKLEILRLYEKVRIAAETLKEDVEFLRRATENQAEEMISLMLFRKTPRASNEITERKLELAKEQTFLEGQIAEIEDRIRHYISMIKSLST